MEVDYNFFLIVDLFLGSSNLRIKTGTNMLIYVIRGYSITRG